MNKRQISVEPELLTREDRPTGRWQVDECRAERGEPQTDIINRRIKVPTYDDALAKCIRAHELMHAKVSPAENWGDWIDRKIASESAMVAVEELRVNTLCIKAGFPLKENLTSFGDMEIGERIVATNDWKSAVHFAVATAGTIANKQFLNGVRRHNRDWGAILLDISKRAFKQMNKIHTPYLSSTLCHDNGLSPKGFAHTERIAQWVDFLTDKTPEELRKEQEEKSKNDNDRIKKAGGDTGSSLLKTHDNRGVGEEPEQSGNPFKGITPVDAEHFIPSWGKLIIERLPMPNHSKGNLGKKKIACNVGMRPRRMHRYMTDPQMRIFDRTVRGSGGVVILDASGSMSFSHEQLMAILENAPGATVAMYSDRHDNGGVNCWIVADKGRLVNQLPQAGSGNGVDFPAIEWGYRQKKMSSTPMIWVTDGGVCGPNQPFSDILAMQCLTYCKQKNIIIVPHAEEAINQLQNIRRGEKAKNIFPRQFNYVYQKITGTSLQ